MRRSALDVHDTRRPMWRFRWWWGMAVLLVAFGGLPAFAAQPLTLSGQTYAYIPPAPRWIGAVALAADTSKTVTLPTFANESGRKLLVTFMPPCANLYLRSVVLGGVTVGGAASIATGDVSDGTASLRNPGSLIFGQGDQVALISPTDCNVPYRVDLVTD